MLVRNCSVTDYYDYSEPLYPGLRLGFILFLLAIFIRIDCVFTTLGGCLARFSRYRK